MNASFILSGSPGTAMRIEDYERISTIDQAESYFSKSRNIDSIQRQSACALVLHLFRNYQTLSPAEHLRAWRIKQMLVSKNPELFKNQFLEFVNLPLPKGFEKKPELAPRLPPCPKLPPIPKKRIYQKIDSMDGFVIVEDEPDKEACEQHLQEVYDRELRFQKEVLSLFLHDYGSHLFSNHSVRYLWQTQLSTHQEEAIEKIAKLLAFPEPAPFTTEQKKLLLGTLKGLELFFQQFPDLLKNPRQTDSVEQTIHMTSAFEELISVLLEPHLDSPFRPFVASALGHLISEKLLNALQPEQLFLIINHICDIDFQLIVSDPSPPLESFKAEDLEFSRNASESIYRLLQSLIRLVPVNPIEKKIMEQAQEWLKEHKSELGETLQLAIERILKTPGRLNITQGLFFLLWDVKEGKTTAAFPNNQKGKELAQAPRLLEKKFVSFLHRLVKWQIDHAVSERNIGIRILAKAGQAISDKPIQSNLKKLGKILFKLFNNRGLMLNLAESVAQEIRLSKNV